MDNDTFVTEIGPLLDYLEEEIRRELVAQKHVATGNLRDSIAVAVRKTAYGYVVEGTGKFYGKYVDRGRGPGGKKVPIDALIAWIRVKGISVSGKKERDLAFAIQHTIFKNGIPTDKNRSRTQFLSQTLEKNTLRIGDDITKAIGDFLRIDIHNIIEDTKKTLQ